MKTQNTFYFDHDYSARNDQKILTLRFRHGWEGYGVYWACLEIMAADSTGYIQKSAIAGLEQGLSLAQGWLEPFLDTCVDVGLFNKCDHGNYYSKRILEHKDFRKKQAENGKKGGLARVAQAPLKHRSSTRCILKERKGEDSLHAQIVDKFYKFYEKQFGQKYTTNAREFKTLKEFLDLNPGMTIDRFGVAADNCLDDEFHKKHLSIHYICNNFVTLERLTND